MIHNGEKVKPQIDGLTILRFAHAYESGGGVEQHLADLNRELSKRNRLITIQLQLTRDSSRLAETEERIGNSLIIKVPLFVQRNLSAGQNNSKSGKLGLLKSMQQFVLNLFLFTSSLNNFAMAHFMRWRRVPRRAGEPEDAGAKAAEIMQRFKVDLVILHASGGADASEIIEVAKSARIPVAIVYHFSNDRLGGVSLRQQISCVDGVAGASWIGVPAYLGKYFWNLSDAVDTEFYRRENARPLPRKISGPVLYTPARVTPEKGQTDVIEVASILKRRGLGPKVIFAGRVDSPDFEAELRQMAVQRGLSDAVEFLGPLSLEEYRDWYGAALVMVMPTRHHEGMPRTLIDSQAMQVPPVVYNVGGTREGLKDKETGYLLRPGDVDGVARAVETLIRNPDLHRCMAYAGRKFVEENFSLQAFAERHENFYSHVIETSRASLHH
jgi:glycosyltransferase involved in cell wall biosynthesis